MGRLSSNGTETNAKAETHTRQAFQDDLRPFSQSGRRRGWGMRVFSLITPTYLRSWIK
jgi:hypothetical protein